MKEDPYSLFSLTDYVELRPGEKIFLSLEPVTEDPKWLKSAPEKNFAAITFDGTNITLDSEAEKIPQFQGREWKAPNGVLTRSSSVKRGYVWIYLHAPQKSKFSAEMVPWYPFNPKAVVRAKIDRTRADDKPVVKTTKGDSRDYKVLGVAHFSYGGKKQELQLFTTNPEKLTELFIAFKDPTNNADTYGGGRYVEAKLASADSGQVTIDFNRAYNPYCAYSHFWNCPLISGNKLSVAMKAGAKLPPRRLDGESH